MIPGIRIRFHVKPDSSEMRFKIHTIDSTGHHTRANKPLEYENWPIRQNELSAL